METSPSGLKPSPLIGPGEGLKPKVAPKPKVKSKTVAGIALPGPAEAIHARQLKKTEVTKKVCNFKFIILALSILNAPKFLKEQCWENFALHHAEFVRGYIHFIHILYTDIARER